MNIDIHNAENSATRNFDYVKNCEYNTYFSPIQEDYIASYITTACIFRLKIILNGISENIQKLFAYFLTLNLYSNIG